MYKKVFISCSSKDAKVASSICHALEGRGHGCWISSRDVTPGENYQGAIVRAITDAGAMVMVFSTNANNSEEIKKELALASQSNLIVIPVRAEDVLPSEDFRYELATRQWIDLFDDWEQAIETLGRKVDGVIPRTVEPWMCAMEMMEAHKPTPSPFAPKPGKPDKPRDSNPLPKIVIGTLALLALTVMAGGAWLMRPPPPAVPQGMMMMREADMHPPPGMDPARLETDLWDAVKDSGNDAALNSYLAKFPDGIFAAAARARIETLNSKGAAPAAAPTAARVKTASAAPPVNAAIKPAAPAPLSHDHAMAMAMPASSSGSSSADGNLNGAVQMAVSMARSSETRAREMAQSGEQAFKLAQTGTAGYGTQAVHEGVQWSGRLADLNTGAPAVVTYANGARYAGGTRGGHRNGVGVFTGTPSMAFHERVGEFAADQMSGYGVVYRNDGRVRAGQWKSGVAEGYGAVYDTKGKLVEQGLFSGDKLLTPLGGN
jgi:hypothetical protein